jgi:predicted amidohydrolase YtcJ
MRPCSKSITSCKNGELSLRIYAMLSDEDSTFLNKWLERGRQYGCLPDDRSIGLTPMALGSRGAALLEPYADDPSTADIHNAADIESLTLRARSEVFVAHAIGDAARIVLTNMKSLIAPQDHRLRIEHCQIVSPRPAALRQARRHRPMQPTDATSDMPGEDRLGSERIKELRLAASCNPVHCLGIGFPSNLPIRSGDYAAVTRQDQSHPPGGCPRAESDHRAVRDLRLTPPTPSRNSRGSIAVGKLADFTVLDMMFSTLPCKKSSRRP